LLKAEVSKSILYTELTIYLFTLDLLISFPFEVRFSTLSCEDAHIMCAELGITFLELLPFCYVKVPSLGGLFNNLDMALTYYLV